MVRMTRTIYTEREEKREEKRDRPSLMSVIIMKPMGPGSHMNIKREREKKEVMSVPKKMDPSHV